MEFSTIVGVFSPRHALDIVSAVLSSVCFKRICPLLRVVNHLPHRDGRYPKMTPFDRRTERLFRVVYQAHRIFALSILPGSNEIQFAKRMRRNPRGDRQRVLLRKRLSVDQLIKCQEMVCN